MLLFDDKDSKTDSRGYEGISLQYSGGLNDIDRACLQKKKVL